jgi:hypothetical protein
MIRSAKAKSAPNGAGRKRTGARLMVCLRGGGDDHVGAHRQACTGNSFFIPVGGSCPGLRIMPSRRRSQPSENLDECGTIGELAITGNGSFAPSSAISWRHEPHKERDQMAARAAQARAPSVFVSFASLAERNSLRKQTHLVAQQRFAARPNIGPRDLRHANTVRDTI